MELANERAIIEAILFLENETLSKKAISRISGLSETVIDAALKIMEGEYQNDSHGLEILKIGESYCLSPKEKYWGVLKEHYGKKNEDKLSRAAMETLSIIAYSQPLTKTEVENIRGVSADNMIRLLARRGFIKDVGKKDVPGKPLLYGTTKEFLKVFKLGSIADLPKLEEQDRDRFELNG